jgi:hypothetical protein
MSKVDDNQDIGIGGFTALARVREQETKTANAPTIPLEDGSFANDHIILNPIQLSIEGRVSSVHLKPRADISVFKRLAAEVGNITKYAPSRTQTQISRVAGLIISVNDSYNRINTAIKDGRQAFEFFGSKDSETSLIEKFLEMLDGYYESRTVMQIEIRSKIYENMVITSRVITRDNTTDDAIDFKITAQQLRFAEVIYSDVQKYFKEPAPGAAGDQVKGQESNGLNDSPEAETSLLGWGVSKFK